MLGQMVNVAPCPRCRGEGRIVETPCETCRGEGRTERKRTLRVAIPAGIDEGHQIRLSSEGEIGPRGGAAGSLYVAVHVAAHPKLTREGTELFYEAPLSIAQAALGTKIRVPTIEGDDTEVEIKPGTQPGTEIRLRGRGVPASPPPVGARAICTSSPTSSSRPSSRSTSASCSRRSRRSAGDAVSPPGGLREKLGLG